MQKLVFLIKRNREMSHDSFRSYYEDRHVALALSYIRPYLVDYRRSYPKGSVALSGEVGDKASADLSTWGFDCITEMWFADQESLNAMYAVLSQPDVLAIMSKDEAYFIDRKAVVVLPVDEIKTHLA